MHGVRRFENLLVDADEVRRLVRVEAPKSGYSKREVETAVPGLRQEVVVALVKHGHLIMAEEFCPKNRRRIPVVTQASIEAFATRYATIAEIGKANDIPARTALRLLQEADVRAAFDTSTVGAWIYERSMVGDESLFRVRTVGRTCRGLAPDRDVQLLEG